MRGKLEKEGNYELFQTTEDHRILKLGSKFYAVVEGQQSDILVYSNSDHEKKKTVSKGKFYLADFDNDPEFRDQPHLFMQDGKHFKEYVLPNDLPTSRNKRVRLIRSKEKLPESKVLEHVKGKGNKGSEKKYEGKAEGLRAKSKSELYEQAKKADVSGRSKMSKEELVKALEKS